eukprot:Hpha_TRINITY_DN24055_c0_g1::TRINITY_DN24055_c0_g1_i1::g.130343::m.130343
MERLEMSLRDVINKWRAEGRLVGGPSLVRWTQTILSALAVVHQRGYIHGDVKPENILMRQPLDLPDPLELDPVLSDFGSAAEIDQHGRRGTRGYEAPEVRGGEKRTPRADVWSLGATVVDTGLLTSPEEERGGRWRAADAPEESGPEMLRGEGYSDKVVEFCSAVLCKMPQDRPDADISKYKL